MRDHASITVQDVGGLFDRGRDDLVPPNHLRESTNVVYFGGEIRKRFGTSISLSNISNIRRIELYTRTGEATRLLVLDNQGRLYDSSSPSSPILQITGMADFKMVTFFNRAYITPIGSDGRGVPGSFIYVYDGTGIARKAAGNRPSGTLNVANSTLAGNVEAGFHLFAVAFETASGYITKPGPAIYGLIEAPGGKKVELSNIPTGPTGTIARHILATRSIIRYDGNQEGYEFFFVPNGRIPNNTQTTLTVDFFDADLFKSAEYLFDQIEELPAASGIGQYRGRMIYWEGNYIYFSKIGEPESFDALEGMVLVNPGESSDVKNCTEFRDTLYIDKQYGSYSTQDNGRSPGTWIVVSIDKGTGSGRRGTVRILDAQGTNIDQFIVCTLRGIVLFNGSYQRPELTFKIEDIWRRINKSVFDLVHGCNDPTRSTFYVAVPLDGASYCSHILVGNYENGLDPVNIRWSIWSSPVWAPRSILIDVGPDGNPVLKIGSDGGVYSLSSVSYLDSGQDIEAKISTSKIVVSPGYIGHFNQVVLRGWGSGDLNLKLLSEDLQSSQNLAPIALSPNPGKEYRVLANFMNEKATLELSNQSGWFSLQRIDIYAKPLWASRPV